MKALIIYDSNFGNTEKIAESIAEVLGAKARLIKATDFRYTDLAGVNLLIVGCPINAWRPTKNTVNAISRIKTILSSVYFATFDTRIQSFMSGNAAKKIHNSLLKLGAEAVAAPEGFIVMSSRGPLKEGELERARNWAQIILSRLFTDQALAFNIGSIKN